MRFKRLVSLLIFTLALFMTAEAGIFSGLFGKKKKNESKVLKIWAFTDELKIVVDDFKAENPGVEVEFTIIPDEDYPTKLKPVLRSGVEAPDLFLGEMASVKKWVDTKFWEDLNKISPEKVKKYEDQAPGYVVDMGRDKNGVLRAVSWQATPGGYFYRRSLAKKYLGTDDPAEVSKLISTPEKFLEIARLLKAKSNGEVKMLTGFADYEWIAKAGRKHGWVNENKEFIIDDAMLNYFEISKTLRDEDLTAKVNQWTPAWFANMKDNKVFGYFLPTWGFHYVIKKNAPDTSGDWAIAKGPSSYYWGGTWIGIYSKSKQKDLAFQFLEKLAIQNKYMEHYTRETGDFMSNLPIDNILANEAGTEFLAGQNHYKFFMEEAKNITPGLETQYDQDINLMMLNSIREYLDGSSTKDEAVKSFKDKVSNAFPNLKVN